MYTPCGHGIARSRTGSRSALNSFGTETARRHPFRPWKLLGCRPPQTLCNIINLRRVSAEHESFILTQQLSSHIDTQGWIMRHKSAPLHTASVSCQPVACLFSARWFIIWMVKVSSVQHTLFIDNISIISIIRAPNGSPVFLGVHQKSACIRCNRFIAYETGAVLRVQMSRTDLNSISGTDLNYIHIYYN